jgi:hypothetical protein
MTKSQIAELVRWSNYPELQKRWKLIAGDEVFNITVQQIQYIVMTTPKSRGSKYDIWLSRIEDCLSLISKQCGVEYPKELIGVSFDGPKTRIACLKALKGILTGGGR